MVDFGSAAATGRLILRSTDSLRTPPPPKHLPPPRLLRCQPTVLPAFPMSRSYVETNWLPPAHPGNTSAVSCGRSRQNGGAGSRLMPIRSFFGPPSPARRRPSGTGLRSTSKSSLSRPLSVRPDLDHVGPPHAPRRGGAHWDGSEYTIPRRQPPRGVVLYCPYFAARCRPSQPTGFSAGLGP